MSDGIFKSLQDNGTTEVGTTVPVCVVTVSLAATCFGQHTGLAQEGEGMRIRQDRRSTCNSHVDISGQQTHAGKVDG